MRLHLLFAGLVMMGAIVWASPIIDVAKLALNNETYSHVLMIPAISLILIATHRKRVFANLSGKPSAGLSICSGGLALYLIATVFQESFRRQAFRAQDVPNDYLTLCMAGLVVWVIGSFIAVYGVQAFQKARFPLLFLGFSIPIPMFLLDGIVTSLQHASAEASDIVFKLSGASYYRSGLVFEFSNLAVQVAEQCSGIRSSLALLILSILAGYLFLRTMSRRVVLALAVFPLTVAKNALRIVTITLLANQVDMRFLTGHWIHRGGGVLFFATALALFIPLVWMLRKSETRQENATEFTSNLT